MKWIDKIPLGHLVLIALMLAVMPAIFPPHPEPHLVEKLKMLADGVLVKPLDIFDLLLHGTPITLLLIRLVRIWSGKV
ncbi:MAG: RND transporter [Gammaproteobacteria bacterium]|uniref:RND transporter n=1 Tax=Candidatus Thiopontia autotrophica TaxID=2841688 RepID=A0A8J6NY84_9GAMM|nr:RND transporter [Candidatus Thiopontia autotrophica]